MMPMTALLNAFLFFAAMHTQVIVDFDKGADLGKWQIVDDVVMGGRSAGSFQLNADGYAVFEGTVSLANNGGFSSVRHRFKKRTVRPSGYVTIRLKGDGKNYQFRIKNDQRNYYTYIYTFETSGEWQEITIPFNKMVPSFRGAQLDMPLFSHTAIEELSLLIANKRNENFKLLIDVITVH